MSRKIYILAVTVLLSLGFTACEKGEGEDDYGFAYLYMPQATVSGGLNNNYPVPSGEGEYTYNFKVDPNGQNLNIMLGVLRSGKLSNSAYTVDIISRADTTAQIVASGVIENAVVMPESFYNIPEKVNVPGNKNGETFYMSVPLSGLKQATYTGKKLVTTVAITNPSKYELNTQKSSTVVIIDVDDILDIIE